ncbi:Hsp33 family molecular chaperone HslO [Acetobacter sp. AN02]|uniref:Hsp33 family molecular chaperone HslO n=1 Tax=Acetobacter sp. AN02 TaxID=2894186 RepID=UPI0024342A71|nr:Hsp33 family molecular chaperone HslO [Acetobacter sp. AN02]MDG6093534.1 Hsp33 family molecular chaperone HslO [Acetobacter sp. AN02]
MIATPAFLDGSRPDVPDLVVTQGVTPFYLDNQPVRGRLVRPGVLTDALLSRHDNPYVISALAGKALALVGGLASALKFQGSFSLQIRGDGPVSMVVADCTDDGALRFYVRHDEEELEQLLGEITSPTDRDLVGSGYMALTVDQGPETERHQGIVEITGDDLAEMAMHYFETSEQHSVFIRLASAMTDSGWRTGGLIMEKIAAEGGVVAEHITGETSPEGDEAWETALMLARTLTGAELLDDNLSSSALLYRLFHEQELCLGHDRALAYGCRCSRARLAGVLGGFSEDDLDHMTECDTITMTCEFCNVSFRFDRDEISTARG